MLLSYVKKFYNVCTSYEFFFCEDRNFIILWIQKYSSEIPETTPIPRQPDRINTASLSPNLEN